MKRKNLSDELRPFYPLLGMTQEKVEEWLKINKPMINGHLAVVRIIKPGDGVFMDSRSYRVNAKADQDGRIISLDDIG